MPTMHNLLTYRSRLRSQTAYIRILLCEVNRVDSMAAAENDCIQSKLPLILHCQLHSRFIAALTLHSYNITQLVKIYCACAKLAQTRPAMYHVATVSGQALEIYWLNLHTVHWHELVLFSWTPFHTDGRVLGHGHRAVCCLHYGVHTNHSTAFSLTAKLHVLLWRLLPLMSWLDYTTELQAALWPCPRPFPLVQNVVWPHENRHELPLHKIGNL